MHVDIGIKHWHGARSDSWFSHLSISVPNDAAETQWLEPVDDTAYEDLYKLAREVETSK